MIPSKQGKKRGFILLVTAVSLVVLVGVLGLAVDLGRVYIVKNEGQAFADIAAIAAARKLDGKSSGIDNAKTEVAKYADPTDPGSHCCNGWLFGTKLFTSGIRTVEFATKAPTGTTCSTTWTTTPSSPYTDYGCVRVTVNPVVNLSFIPAAGASYTQTVMARAVAGVVPQTFPLGGYMPFTPFAHSQNCTSLGPPPVPTGCDTTGNFGFSIGEEYGFHWPGSINSKGSACHGDQASWPAYNFSDQVGGSVRGYFTLQSASTISQAILGAYQLSPLSVGDTLTMTNGNKQAEATALNTRTSYDTDQTNYKSNTNGTRPDYFGNGMREVVMPVNSGPFTNPQYQVLGFASFLLYTNYSVGGGNQPWCAIYMGSSTDGGGGGVFNAAGAYVVRLVQ
jgi:Flp pilus assembly protein TadG